jgi:predicted flap endonuclease-1-like 5' DNA nuclease
MELNMLKKIFYFGLGLASLLVENFDELARAGEERYNKPVRADQPAEEAVESPDSAAEESIAETSTIDANTVVADDLTKINGIGPTFASRLNEANIATYQQLAELSVDQVRDITQVADWQADPEEWIAQAKAIA